MNELYESLYQFLVGKKFTVKRQNVSLGIKVGNVAIDFVPGKHQGGMDADRATDERLAHFSGDRDSGDS